MTTTEIVTQSYTERTTRRILTKAQKLAEMLRGCRKRPRRQWASCEKRAHREYGTTARKTRKK
jgi:hypothetical protein